MKEVKKIKKYGSPEKIEVLEKESGIINRLLKKIGKSSYIDLDKDEKEKLNKEIGKEKLDG